jgi:hypothetical protein
VPTFFKHLGFANAPIVSRFSSSALSALQQGSFMQVKNVSGFIPMDKSWEGLVNPVVYILFINITIFTTYFSVTNIMSFLKQCNQPFDTLKPEIAIWAATSVAFAHKTEPSLMVLPAYFCWNHLN